MSFIFQIGSHASLERLEKLMEERLKAGADKQAVDDRIWDLFGERWAVMFTDLSGFSRKVQQFGIIHFLQVIHESQRLLVPLIDRHDGILLKMDGDSMLVIFRRPAKALSCAVEMQRALKGYNASATPEEAILLCIGLGYGDMLRIGDSDVFGAEVNAASKLGEDTARAGEILVTDGFKESLAEQSAARFEKLPEAPPGATGAFRVIYA